MTEEEVCASCLIDYGDSVVASEEVCGECANSYVDEATGKTMCFWADGEVKDIGECSDFSPLLGALDD